MVKICTVTSAGMKLLADLKIVVLLIIFCNKFKCCWSFPLTFAITELCVFMWVDRSGTCKGPGNSSKQHGYKVNQTAKIR